MAKVEGPLMSLGARGKIGDAVVFFPWKGIHAVRRWLVPANPKSDEQGDIRLALGTIGKAARCVVLTSDYVDEIKGYMPAGQTWISTLVKAIVADHLADGTAFDAAHGVWAAFGNKALWEKGAADAGLVDFDMAYKSATQEGEAGFQLYLLALYAVQVHAADPSRFDKAPYTKALADWDGDDIDAFGVEIGQTLNSDPD